MLGNVEPLKSLWKQPVGKRLQKRTLLQQFFLQKHSRNPSSQETVRTKIPQEHPNIRGPEYFEGGNQ